MANLTLQRTGRITGSRIAGVLGLSPYNTRDEVMREMVREFHWAEPEFAGNFVTEYGQEHEPLAIAEYELLKGVALEHTGEDQITVIGLDGIAAVTPDGWHPDGKGLAEIKCPFRARYTSWHERPDYEAQMRLQLETAERDYCDFVVWREEEYGGTNITRLHRDRDRDNEPLDWLRSRVRPDGDTVIGEIERFLEEFAQITESEELSAPYLAPIENERRDPEWLAAAAAYLDLQAEALRVNAYLEDAKSQLAYLAGEASAKGAGVHVIYRKPSGGGKGNVSWQKLAEAVAEKADIEITEELKDQHRGKPSKGGGRGSWAFKRYGDADS